MAKQRSVGVSIPTIVGFMGGFGLFVLSIAIATSNWVVFLDLASLIMVVGGTLAAAFISFEPRYVILSLKVIGRIVFAPRVGRGVLQGEVGRIVKWAYLVKKAGLNGLEAEVDKLRNDDALVAFGLDLVITGYNGEDVRDIMTNAIEATFKRNTVQADILKNMASSAPAFGMIGTLVGLVIMLQSMGGDPSSLGQGLAVALITTLYGVLLARLIFLPAATKLQQREEIVRFRNYLVAEGLVLLAERRNPRYIQDRMNAYLDPGLHFDIERAAANRKAA